MKTITFIILAILCTQFSYSQDSYKSITFEVMSRAEQKRDVIYSVYVGNFSNDSASFKEILEYGEILSEKEPGFNIQALFWSSKCFFFKTFDESVEKLKDIILYENLEFNRKCPALYTKKGLLEWPVKHLYRKQLQN